MLCLYPQAKYRPDKPLYPMVVTLEEWFIYGDLIVNKLNEYVLKGLKSVGLSENLIVTNPYCVVSAEAFEAFILIANKHGIRDVLGEKTNDKEKKYWEIENYLRNKYPEDINKAGCPFIPELDQRIDAMLQAGRSK